MRTSNKLKAGLALGALLAAAPGWALPTDFKSKADAYLKSAYPADAPGVAVIVVDDGRVAYTAGQGLADLEAKRAITPATVFRLGSITKQFTAAIILQLADEGKLSLT
ncbi:MAG TPA: serine hydrolase domain-containing protein, partial [Chloroflexota bacterium]|nr:serine hydrolase domain-containing protein [Chloroflexota bacterium]